MSLLSAHTDTPTRLSALVVFMLALAICTSNGYLLLVNHDTRLAPDEHSYLQVARGQWESVPAIHRYRIVVPLLARLTAETLLVGSRLLGYPDRHLSLGFSFFLVNSLLLASAGCLIYRTARAHGARNSPSLLGMLAVLSSGLASYLTGLALVDSALVAILALLWFGCVAHSRGALLSALVLGFALKETFVLFVPLAIFYGRFVPRWQRLAALLAGIAWAWAIRLGVDWQIAAPKVSLLTLLLDHAEDSQAHLAALFSMRGFLALSSVFGLWNGVLLLGLWGGRPAIRSWLAALHPSTGLFSLAVLVHLLLSGDISRMFFLSAPVFGVVIALILDRQPWFTRVLAPIFPE